MQFQILGPLRVTDGHEHEVPLGGAKRVLASELMFLVDALVPQGRGLPA